MIVDLCKKNRLENDLKECAEFFRQAGLSATALDPFTTKNLYLAYTCKRIINWLIQESMTFKEMEALLKEYDEKQKLDIM